MKAIDILIVEDEVILSSCLEMQLKEEGYSVCDTFTTGEEAVNFVQNYTPDLILLDINLAGAIDGIETAHNIIKKKEIPIIFMTAYNEKHIYERAQQVSPKAYLIKPVEIWELKKVINSIF